MRFCFNKLGARPRALRVCCVLRGVCGVFACLHPPRGANRRPRCSEPAPVGLLRQAPRPPPPTPPPPAPQGMPIIGEIPAPGFLEGGDFFPMGQDLAMVGIGLRRWGVVRVCLNVCVWKGVGGPLSSPWARTWPWWASACADGGLYVCV